MFVYLIVCSKSLKIYVGQHKGDNLKKYLQTKLSDAKRQLTRRSHLFNAMRRHPYESWSIWPLVSGIETRAELDEIEKHFIRVLKAQHPDIGYNICAGGEGFTGEFTPEHRAKLRAAIANRDPEVEKLRRRRLSEIQKVSMVGNTNGRGNKGIPHPKDEEFRQRVSKKLTGRKLSPAHAQHIGDGHRGLEYHYTDEARARLASMKGKHHSDEWKEQQRERMQGFQHSEEAKLKMRKPKSAEGRQNMIVAQRVRRQKQTHCKRGHLLNDVNLVKSRLPYRICLTCARERIRAHYWRQKNAE